MIPLNDGIARLDDTGGHGDQSRQRHLDLVIAGLGLALHVHLAVRNGHLLRKRHRRQPEDLGHLDRQRAGVAVGRFRGGDDQIGLGPLDGRSQDFGRTEGIRSGQGRIADQDGLGRAHCQRRAQPARLAVGRHGYQGDLTAAGLLGQLKPHLHSVGVGLVENQLPLAGQGMGARIELRRRSRIGDLLDADDNVHAPILIEGV